MEAPEVGSMTASQAWDSYVEAVNACDDHKAREVKTIEQQWRGIIELRRAAYMAAVEREKKHD